MPVRVGLLLGDPCGIGPELVAKLLASPALDPAVATVVIGEPRILARAQAIAGSAREILEIARLDELDGPGSALLPGPPIDPEDAPLGTVSRVAGTAVLDTFRMALGLADAGELDGICFAPCNKQAMHEGGLELEDELRFFVQVLGFESHVGEVNATDRLATTRVTSHVPLRAVADLITEDGVLQAIRLAERTLRAAGTPRPRIAVAGLNPHAGDGGIFGREEIEVIAPAVERAKAEQIAASGPYPSDTVFLRARDGAFDAVVTMYHDQGQIAMKLLGFERGVTIHAGLPIPITTPAHGSAFDIAGSGRARVDGLSQAYRTACAMAKAARGGEGPPKGSHHRSAAHQP
ncbi:MAG: 4-hydroxythreonine-4-phosphate dehydrogenase [Geminicoccaceae bacterium]|nr:4-hydroxythreonine-4-phosphate dehydrogenase [Geminicoccaceae bacterium]